MTLESKKKLCALAKPKIVPELDKEFCPAVLVNKAFAAEVVASGGGVPLVIGLDRGDGSRYIHKTKVFASGHPNADLNLPYAERLVKFLLWQKGGFRVTIGGPKEIWEYIHKLYSADGERQFDHLYMGELINENDFEVVLAKPEEVKEPNETSMPIGRHLEGCRIGFDLGASDRKVAAVIDGESVFSEEVVWEPRENSDPQYHFDQIMEGLKSAAAHMPRVDAIGGSSAGVLINGRPMIASLFRGIPKDIFNSRIKEIFHEIGKAWGVPIEVANDGDVTALAGAMSLNDGSVLGVAMGSSEAAGYVNAEGNITGWLNELAFVPIDYNPYAPADEWSEDIGCGVQYLTQQAVFRLAPTVGIELDESDTLAGKLKSVQNLLEAGDANARKIWDTIGVYTGYAVAHYADFYDIRHMLILGRVTSGIGGGIILDKAKEVLAVEFPELSAKMGIQLPDEKTRRVGQAVAAASLPVVP